MPDTVISALAEHLQRFPAIPQKLEWTDGRAEEVALIFTSSTGRALNRSTFNDALARAAEATDVEFDKGEGFHRLRHTYASLLIDRNVSPKVIQVRMGHASITETMDTYGHLYPDSDDTTRQAIDDALSSPDAPVDKSMTQSSEA